MMDGWWKYVRHPNYISEQAIWFSFYFFGVEASGQWINWTLSGSVLLIFLFAGSSDFTESISMKKYPDYLDYKENVPRFFPFILKSGQEKNQKQ
jgi:steroid 5-alpha reductase family enzyme